jgi:hypothetical protein
MAKTKSARQVRFLLSKVSPLTADQKAELQRELHSGAVKIGPKKKKARRRRVVECLSATRQRRENLPTTGLRFLGLLQQDPRRGLRRSRLPPKPRQ